MAHLLGDTDIHIDRAGVSEEPCRVRDLFCKASRRLASLISFISPATFFSKACVSATTELPLYKGKLGMYLLTAPSQIVGAKSIEEYSCESSVLTYGICGDGNRENQLCPYSQLPFGLSPGNVSSEESTRAVRTHNKQEIP
jgi:hypothetical protein